MEQVIQYFSRLFSTYGFPPRWYCGSWDSFTGWFYIASDVAIWGAYFAIPLVLLYFVRQRADIPFSRLFVLFGAFIFACGLTHLFDALMFWWPAYRLSGLIYFATAVVSWMTVLALFPVIPKVLSLRSPVELEREMIRQSGELAERSRSLKISEQRYQLLIDGVKDYAIFMLDDQGRMISWNSGAERMYGYKESEVLGQPYSLFFTKDDVLQGKPEKELRFAATLGRYEGESLRKHQSHSRFWVSLNITAQYNPEGEVIGFFQISRDITHQKQAEIALLDSESRMRAILETTVDAIITIDDHAQILSFNQAAIRLFGYSPDEVIGKNVNILMPSPYRQEHDGYLKNYQQTGTRKIIGIGREVTAQRKDGSVFPIELAVSEVQLKDQRIFTGIIRDITQRKKSEQALTESEERFRTMADNTAALIWTAGPDARCDYFNRGWLTFTGRALEQELGEGWLESIHPDDRPVIRQTFLSAFQDKKKRPFEMEYRLRRSDGEYRWVFDKALPRFSSSGEFLGYISSCFDVTERKQAREDLEQMVNERTAQLEAVNKELEAFSYSVSHDLRAPLRAIDGFSQGVLRRYSDKLDEKGRDYLNRIRQGSQQMAQLIDDMLKLSRLTRGELNLTEGIDLSRMATDIAAAFQEQDPQRNVTFDIEPGLVVQGDERLLQAALENLLNNAWKYTSKHPSAHIEFGRIQSRSTSIYYVRDDGAGFDMQYADKLFGAFQRLHGVQEFPGTGVGLATVARIIHRHGGEIWADAAVERGATFYFTLQPINAEEKHDAQQFQQSHSTRGG